MMRDGAGYVRTLIVVNREAVSIIDGYDNTCMEDAKAKRWIIRGRVQGVGFRYFVQGEATALGLKGWVRNLDSGEVEVYASGDDKSLAELAGALHRGPRMAEVRGVDEREAEVHKLTGFSVR
jgi:acylphosphatase